MRTPSMFLVLSVGALSLSAQAFGAANTNADSGALQPFGVGAPSASGGGITPASSAPSVQYNPTPSNPTTPFTYTNTPHPSDGRFSYNEGEGPAYPTPTGSTSGPDVPSTPLPSPFGLGACGLLSVMAISRRRARR